MSRFRPRLSALVAALALASGSALLTACERTHDAARYFPLEPGHAWQYRVERTTMDGRRELRHAVRSRRVPRGLDADGLRETLDGRPYLYTVAEEGIYRLNPALEAGAASGSENAVLVLPHTVDASARWESWSQTTVLENTGPPWETLFRITVPVRLHYRVETTDAEVETPAGRFRDCLVISGHGTASVDVGNYIGRTRIAIATREWFAPGVGLVRMERDETTGAAALSAGRLVVELDRWRRP